MTNAKPLYNKIALIGLGLIGGSIGLAAKRAGLAGQISGSARTKETRDVAIERGLVHQVFETAAEAAADADLVILCTPVGALGPVAAEIKQALKPGATVTDVGSVKAAVIEAVQPYIPEGVHLVPAHPVAGTEFSGPHAGFADLFENRWCILTPLSQDISQDYADAVDRLERFWRACGSQVDRMDAKHHDLVLAITSHVPHLIAYNIVGTADDLEAVTQSEVIKYSASGFRDFTRIAASDPTMWRDIFLNNSDAVLEMLSRFTEDLTALQRAIRWKDGDALFELFSRTRAIRRSIIEAGQDSDEPDFGRGHAHFKESDKASD